MKPVLILIGLILATVANTQSAGLPLNAPGYHILDRLDVKGIAPHHLHLESKYVSGKSIAQFALDCDKQYLQNHPDDQNDIARLLQEYDEYAADWNKKDSLVKGRTSRMGLLRHFYAAPAHLIAINKPGLKFRLNPVLQVGAGKNNNGSDLIYQNQRGLETRLDIDEKVYGYMQFVETQANFPDYYRRWIYENIAVPGQGLFKGYQSSVLNISNGFDFNNSTAYMGVRATKHIHLEMGHARHFIGNGYRSLFLSDFSTNRFFISANVNVWKIRYQTMLTELSGGLFYTGINKPYTKRFASIHYLNMDITRKMSVGIFESVVYNRSRQVEFQYLNPVILYRSVEGSLGSPDNVLIGLDFKYNLLRKIQLYGQLLVDEFKLDGYFKPEQKGWWGNKTGIQAGAKLIDVAGVNHLDFQIEWNRVRPFTYSHNDSLNSWTHFRQPLAHPLGANFNEIVNILHYQPVRKLTLEGKLLYLYYGENPDRQNWGAQPNLSNEWRFQDYGNTIGQGTLSKTTIAGLDISWEWHHNMFLNLKGYYRHQNSTNTARSLNTFVYSLGLSINSWNRREDF